MGLIDRLRQSRYVTQVTQVQPQQATVAPPIYGADNIARPIGYMEGRNINATRDILSAPVYGSTQPNAFITISGTPPIPAVVAGVGSIAGSNTPEGTGGTTC